MFGRALVLMRASWRVMWAEQSLVLLAAGPAATFAAIILFEAFVASIAPTAAVALLVPACVAVVCSAMLWSAAIVAGANEVCEGRSPTVAGCIHTALRHGGAVCGWAFYSLSVGVLLRLFGSLVGRFGAFLTYAGETAWSVATMLVLPAIVIDEVMPQDAVRRSRAQLPGSWGERLTGQLGFDAVAAALASPALVFLVVAALVDHGPLMGVALLTCFGAFIAAALLTSACLSVYRTMLYRRVTGRSVPVAFDVGVLPLVEVERAGT